MRKETVRVHNQNVAVVEWNGKSHPIPYEMVEILMKDGKIHTDMMVKAKYGNLTWRNWDDKAVVGWRSKDMAETNREHFFGDKLIADK